MPFLQAIFFLYQINVNYNSITVKYMFHSPEDGLVPWSKAGQNNWKKNKDYNWNFGNILSFFWSNQGY